MGFLVHDFRCQVCDTVAEQLVKSGVDTIPCPSCGNTAHLVYLAPPKLDWHGMAQGDNAGPEFIDRWEKQHKREADKEERYMREHGDYGPGKPPPPSIQES